MENISIIEDFLSEEETATVLGIIHDNKWNFGHSSLTNGYKTQDFKTFLEIKENLPLVCIPFWYMELNHYDIFTKQLLDKIQKIFHKKFKIMQIYANGQTFGQGGTYHQDSLETNTYTFCLYLNHFVKEVQENIDGHFMIKIPGEKHILAYEPIFNRGIMFPSNYFHKGNTFSRICADIRISVAWKLKVIE
jgi:hypothetical protein